MFLTVLLLIASSRASAESIVIAKWTFESSKPTAAGPHVAESGADASISTASAYHAGASSYTAPMGNGSGTSFSSTNWSAGDYYEFATSSAGFSDISLSWDQTRSSDAPMQYDLAYSTDGTHFQTMVSDYSVGTTFWNSNFVVGSLNFTIKAPQLLSDAQSLIFRIISRSTAISEAGTAKIDNFVIAGVQSIDERAVAVPLPPAVYGSLFLMGAIAGRRKLRARRRNSSML